MKYYLLILSITLVACKSLQLDPFLSELQDGIRQRNYQNCQRIPDQSFIGDCMQEGDQINSELIAAFRPIAGHEFQKVLENLDGTYYKQDPNTGLWYIPSQGKSNMIGDGIAKNAESLTHTLDVEFKKLLEAYKAYVSSDEFLNTNGLKKRIPNLGSLIRPGVNSVDNLGSGAVSIPNAGSNIDNIVANSADDIGGAPPITGAIPRAWPENFQSLNHYELLGVPRDASLEMINQAYKRKALRWHPDRVLPELRDEAKVVFQQLNEANTALKDPVLRSQYDNFLNRPRPNGSTVRPNRPRAQASALRRYMIDAIIIAGWTGMSGIVVGISYLVYDALKGDIDAETDVVAPSTDIEAETDVVTTSTDFHSQTTAVADDNTLTQVCNGSASLLSDSSTGITYYLDPESCYYYYFDNEKGEYVWYYG